MSKKRRQQILLGLLATILVIVVGQRLGSVFLSDALGRSGAGAGTGRRAGAERADWRAELPQVEELRLDALLTGTDALNEGRDPFQIRPAAPPPRPELSEADLQRRIEEARQRQQTVTPTASRPPAPTPPPIDVVYLGSFGSGRMKLAVFTDGNEIFNVPEGDVLKNKFVVVKIGLESADLGFVGFPEAPARRLEIGG